MRGRWRAYAHASLYMLSRGFLAQNLLLFVLFYEVELIPFYLLIAIWVEHPAWLLQP